MSHPVSVPSSSAPLSESMPVALLLTGEAVIAGLRRGVPCDELARRLARVYRIGYGEALRDVLAFRMAMFAGRRDTQPSASLAA